MRAVVGLVLIGIVIAACAPHESPPAGGADKLYEANTANGAQAIYVVDSKTHATERRLPLGTPSGNWKHLYSIVGGSLVDTDPLTGNTQNTMLLGGDYALPPATSTGMPGGLSPAGYWLVVESHDSNSTRMLVISTSTFKVSDRIELTGRFNFDAVSDDGQRLYLIQYLDDKEYFVRLYNIPANSLDENIVIDKSDGNQAMAGRRLSGVASPDGASLFSMYVREHESPFIHALSLQGPFAWCLDLPGGGYSSWSLAMTHDGSRLFAVGGASGVVAEVDTSNQYSPQIVRTAQVAAGAHSAVLSSDGKTLVTAGESGIRWIDTSSLNVRMRSLAEWNVASLGLSADGKTLYAVSDRGEIAQVAMSSGEVVSRFDQSDGHPMALLRVAAA